MRPGLGILLVSSLAVSLACTIHLWGWRKGSLLRKLFWSIAVWVPMLGPLFYVTMYRVPSKKPDLLQSGGYETHAGG